MGQIFKKTLLLKLGRQIKLLREQKGLSQTELANTINKDQQSIQRLESGNINPSFYYLYEVAIGLQVSINELLDFDLEETSG